MAQWQDNFYRGSKKGFESADAPLMLDTHYRRAVSSPNGKVKGE